jgi:hypothetical protein
VVVLFCDLGCNTSLESRECSILVWSILWLVHGDDKCGGLDMPGVLLVRDVALSDGLVWLEDVSTCTCMDLGYNYFDYCRIWLPLPMHLWYLVHVLLKAMMHALRSG